MTDNSVLDDLWARFGHIARSRVDVLAEAVTVLTTHADDAGEAPHVTALRAAARDECHKLVGALDSYGRTGGSALAARAEQLLAARPGPRELAALGEVTAGLLALFDAAFTAVPCVCPRCGNTHSAVSEEG